MAIYSPNVVGGPPQDRSAGIWHNLWAMSVQDRQRRENVLNDEVQRQVKELYGGDLSAFSHANPQMFRQWAKLNRLPLDPGAITASGQYILDKNRAAQEVRRGAQPFDVRYQQGVAQAGMAPPSPEVPQGAVAPTPQGVVGPQPAEPGSGQVPPSGMDGLGAFGDDVGHRLVEGALLAGRMAARSPSYSGGDASANVMGFVASEAEKHLKESFRGMGLDPNNPEHERYARGLLDTTLRLGLQLGPDAEQNAERLQRAGFDSGRVKPLLGGTAPSKSTLLDVYRGADPDAPGWKWKVPEVVEETMRRGGQVIPEAAQQVGPARRVPSSPQEMTGAKGFAQARAQIPQDIPGRGEGTGPIDLSELKAKYTNEELQKMGFIVEKDGTVSDTRQQVGEIEEAPVRLPTSQEATQTARESLTKALETKKPEDVGQLRKDTAALKEALEEERKNAPEVGVIKQVALRPEYRENLFYQMTEALQQDPNDPGRILMEALLPGEMMDVAKTRGALAEADRLRAAADVLLDPEVKAAMKEQAKLEAGRLERELNLKERQVVLAEKAAGYNAFMTGIQLDYMERASKAGLPLDEVAKLMDVYNKGDRETKELMFPFLQTLFVGIGYKLEEVKKGFLPWSKTNVIIERMEAGKFSPQGGPPLGAGMGAYDAFYGQYGPSSGNSLIKSLLNAPGMGSAEEPRTADFYFKQLGGDRR